MTDDTECHSELWLRARNGTLAPSERAAFERHLRDCPWCQLSHDVSLALAESGRVRVDDAEHLGGMLDASARWLDEPRSLTRRSDRKRRVRVAILVAALSVTAAAAATTLALRGSFHRAQPAPASRVSAPATHDVDTSAFVPSPAPNNTGERLSPRVETTPPPAASSSSPVAAQPSSRALAARAAEETPARLLQRATEARRAGNTPDASRLFSRLQQRFPSSRESHLSEVVYGSMLLEQGQARRALQQFEQYLSAGAGRSLAAEALYGKGRALMNLGREADERATWQALIRQFPKSPYVSHARKRLASSR